MSTLTISLTNNTKYMEDDNIENDIENKGNQNQKDNQKQIAGAIIIAGIIIAGAVLLKDSSDKIMPAETANNDNNLTAIDLRPVSADEHIVGNSDAKIVIVEYSDTECPYCKVFQNTLHIVITKNNNDVAWVYRHYPIAQLHPKAFHEAEATECAWEQGGNFTFWKYIDEIFARTESNNRLDVAELPKIAKDIGLDVSSFNTCLENGKYASKIQNDIEDGNKAGAKGTPYSVIVTKNNISTKTQNNILTAINSPGAVSFSSTKKNQMSMNGALPVDMVNKIIEILLK